MAGATCIDTGPVEHILSRYPHEEASLIQVLQDVQREYRYLPCEILAKVAETLNVPLAKIFSVGTFYKAFSLTPQGKVIIKICTGTACHIRGAPQLIDEMSRKIGIQPGETSEDMSFTLKTVNCVGACAMAPVVIVNEEYHGNAKVAKVSSYVGQGGGHDEN
ncbi:MAG: NAD(P)H-dependent oxidoreductase subunit E [Acidobacteriota bacterium]